MLAPGSALAQPLSAEQAAALRAEVEALKAENARLAGRLDQVLQRLGPGPAASAPPPEAAAPPAPAVATAPAAPAPAPPAAAAGPADAGIVLAAQQPAPPAAPSSTADKPGNGVNGAKVEISAASGSGKVSVTLGRSITSNAFAEGAEEGWYKSRNWTLTASAPLSKKGDSTDIGTLDGFASDFELRLERSWLRRRLREPALDDAGLAGIEDRGITACSTRAGVTDILKEKEACAAERDKDGLAFVSKYLTPADVNAYIDAFYPRKSAYGYGVEGHIGYKSHSFIDLAALKTESEDHVPWGAKVFGTWLPTGRGYSFTGSLEYQQDYEDQKSQVICPAATGPSAQCLSGALGKPERKEKLLTGLEWRAVHFRGEDRFIKMVGISAQVTYDAKNGESGIDVPIYFVPDEKNNLIGGFRFGWTSEKDDFVAGIFVGAPFATP